MELSDGIISKFNAGALQMQRLHDLQQNINNSNANLSAFNTEMNCWNYELLFSRLNSLFQEASSKLNKEELEHGIEIQKCIRDHLKKHPIYERLENPDNNKVRTRINNTSWEKFQDLIFLYEKEVRGYLEKHKLNAPPEDESDLF